eukprot:COSAG05_NODE_11052_length_533_cov_0.723502_1_plen_121_part_01
MMPELEFSEFPEGPAPPPRLIGKLLGQVSNWRAGSGVGYKVRPERFTTVPGGDALIKKEPGEPRRHFTPPPPPTFQPHLPPASPPIRLTLSPRHLHPFLPNPSHMYSTRRGGRYRGRDGPR